MSPHGRPPRLPAAAPPGARLQSPVIGRPHRRPGSRSLLSLLLLLIHALGSAFCAGSCAQIIRLCACPAPQGGRMVRLEGHDADPVCPGYGRAIRPSSGGCRRPSGIGEGGTSERRVDAWLRKDAGLMRICRREGKGPPAANGRRRPFALVNQVSGRARERVDVRVAER